MTEIVHQAWGRVTGRANAFVWYGVCVRDARFGRAGSLFASGGAGRSVAPYEASLVLNTGASSDCAAIGADRAILDEIRAGIHRVRSFVNTVKFIVSESLAQIEYLLEHGPAHSREQCRAMGPGAPSPGVPPPHCCRWKS